jgi:nucleolar protein 58
VNDRKKYNSLSADDIHNSMFVDAAMAQESLELVSFQPFVDTADAVSAITACQEGRVSASLQQFLTKKFKKMKKGAASDHHSHALAVADKALAISINQDTMSSLEAVKVMHDDKTNEVFRGIRCYMEELLSNHTTSDGSATNLSMTDLRKMQLGLSHSLGRYKLKFSADKVDTMIIQAIGLLDEMDKEINTYAMRVKVRSLQTFLFVLLVRILFVTYRIPCEFSWTFYYY